MSDFRIDSLNNSNYVMDYNSYIVTDKSGQNPLLYARKLDIDNLSNNYEFYSYYDNFSQDFIFYNNLIYTYSSNLFKIDNSNNLNISFTNDGVIYTPSGYSYCISSNSQSLKYGDYIEIDKEIDNLDITYILNPQIYSKEYIDYIIGTCNFEVDGDTIIDVTNEDNYYTIKNLALYTNEDCHIFNPFYDGIYIISKSVCNFDLKRTYRNAGTFSSIFSISNSDSLKGNSLVISNRNVASNTPFMSCSFVIVGDGDRDCIIGEWSLVMYNNFTNSRDDESSLSFIISDNINFALHNYECEVFVGIDNDSYLSINKKDNDYKFMHIARKHSNDYGLYINNDKIYVGSITDKKHDTFYAKKDQNISFGGYSPDYAGTYKFVICGEDYFDDYLFVVMQEGVYYNRTNLLDNLDDDYIYSSYEDILIHRESIRTDVLYYN